MKLLLTGACQQVTYSCSPVTKIGFIPWFCLDGDMQTILEPAVSAYIPKVSTPVSVLLDGGLKNFKWDDKMNFCV